MVTLFYRGAEGWSLLDSLYFSVVTLTTIGFGDLAPSSPGAKAFTIAYSLLGIGVIAAFITALASAVRADREQSDTAWHSRHPRGRRRSGEGSTPEPRQDEDAG